MAVRSACFSQDRFPDAISEWFRSSSFHRSAEEIEDVCRKLGIVMNEERLISNEAPGQREIIRIDEGKIRDHPGEIVRQSVEKTLNWLSYAEAERLSLTRPRPTL